MAIKHGGNLNKIAAEYGTDPECWIDLSTGVSPFTYPIGDIPLSVWNQLPQNNDGLEVAARRYYGGFSDPVIVAGSQAAIVSLPAVLTKEMGRCGTISLPRVGYKEHQHAWTRFEQDSCGWNVLFYDDFPSEQQVAESDVVLIINPNNPTGKFSSKNALAIISQKMQEKKGYLIVDEAFADCTPEISMLSTDEQQSSLIILRSVGKFFGLAGARVGFVFASENIKGSLEALLGPWTVTGPARWVMKKALSDHQWQKEVAHRIKSASIRLSGLLGEYLDDRTSVTDLFITVYLDEAAICHDFLCQQHVLTRLCDEKNALRFGLPADETQWKKLESALYFLARNRVATRNKDPIYE
ncbi:threonine-phosphate decarboxylase CobD [Vibrio sp. F74]|uniref:threonine-phosphate decarboxylase CobD n=1 Tax=Vibrio sp. F74 TaxID=700020 RepID=UPI0035F5A32D